MDSGAIRRRMALGLAVLAAAGLLAFTGAGSAQAAASSCSGRKVRTLPFTTGSVQVYKRSGYVCAVTFPGARGSRKPMSVSVQARGEPAGGELRTLRASRGPGDPVRGPPLCPGQRLGRIGLGEFRLDPVLNHG